MRFIFGKSFGVGAVATFFKIRKRKLTFPCPGVVKAKEFLFSRKKDRKGIET